VTLLDLCNTQQYDTDKFFGHPFQWHSYIENFYSKTFANKQHTARNVLEVGIYTGGSLKLWRDYFVNATVFGIDTRSTDLLSEFTLSFNELRMYQIYGDAYSDELVQSLKDSYYDIIIDDGPHTLESQCIFAQNYFDKLKPGGYFVCEDISSIENWYEIKNFLPMEYQDKTQLIDLREIDNRYDSIILFVEK